MTNFGFGRKIMILNILKLDVFHIPWIYYTLEGILQKYVENINLM